MTCGRRPCRGETGVTAMCGVTVRRGDSHVHVSPRLSPSRSQTRNAAGGKLRQTHGRARCHHSPARAQRPAGARSGRWLGHPRRPRCKERREVTELGGCSLPDPLGDAPQVLTAGPGSWRARRRSGAAPGSGPGSSSAPPRPAGAARGPCCHPARCCAGSCPRSGTPRSHPPHPPIPPGLAALGSLPITPWGGTWHPGGHLLYAGAHRGCQHPWEGAPPAIPHQGGTQGHGDTPRPQRWRCPVAGGHTGTSRGV